jgi:hypothetical protein
MVNPKNVPLPTEVSPTTKPQTTPMATAFSLSFRPNRNAVSGTRLCRIALSRKPMPQTSSDTPSTVFAVLSQLFPYACSSHVASTTPASDSGAEPSSIQSVSDRLTVPS